jgi:hypothetical protein
LRPYRVPHLEPSAENIIRVDSHGVVIYRAEEAEQISALPDVMETEPSSQVPPSGVCYARRVATVTRGDPPLFKEPDEDGSGGLLSRKSFVRTSRVQFIF